MPMRQALEISPEDWVTSQIIPFMGPYNVPKHVELDVKNPTEREIAYKWITTAPNFYRVLPAKGKLLAGGCTTLRITFAKNCSTSQTLLKHRFTLLTCYVPREISDLDEIFADLHPAISMETRFRVIHNFPPATSVSDTPSTSVSATELQSPGRLLIPGTGQRISQATATSKNWARRGTIVKCAKCSRRRSSTSTPESASPSSSNERLSTCSQMTCTSDDNIPTDPEDTPSKVDVACNTTPNENELKVAGHSTGHCDGARCHRVLQDPMSEDEFYKKMVFILSFAVMTALAYLYLLFRKVPQK